MIFSCILSISIKDTKNMKKKNQIGKVLLILIFAFIGMAVGYAVGKMAATDTSSSHHLPIGIKIGLIGLLIPAF